MRCDLENIYTILPFGNDIKYNIYTQMYKNHSTIPTQLKDDLLSYFLLYKILVIYEEKRVADDIDKNFFLYSLYNDLIHNNHYNRSSEADSLLFHNLYLHTFFDAKYYDMYTACSTMNNLISITDCFVMKRIKYYWKILSPKKRKKFYVHVKSFL